MYVFLYFYCSGCKRNPDVWTLPYTLIVFLQISISVMTQILICASPALQKGVDTSFHLIGTAHEGSSSSRLNAIPGKFRWLGLFNKLDCL